MTVAELEHRMGARELMDWMAFEEIEVLAQQAAHLDALLEARGRRT